MNALTLFGLFAVTAMLVCYWFEKRSRWFILGDRGFAPVAPSEVVRKVE